MPNLQADLKQHIVYIRFMVAAELDLRASAQVLENPAVRGARRIDKSGQRLGLKPPSTLFF